jgi:hypothetical protein
MLEIVGGPPPPRRRRRARGRAGANRGLTWGDGLRRAGRPARPGRISGRDEARAGRRRCSDIRSLAEDSSRSSRAAMSQTSPETASQHSGRLPRHDEPCQKGLFKLRQEGWRDELLRVEPIGLDIGAESRKRSPLRSWPI